MQVERLHKLKNYHERLLKDGYNVKKVEYPNYDSESSSISKNVF